MHKVAFLGHRVGADGIKVDPDKVKAVERWPTPENQTHVRSFLGLANYLLQMVTWSKITTAATTFKKLSTSKNHHDLIKRRSKRSGTNGRQLGVQTPLQGRRPPQSHLAAKPSIRERTKQLQNGHLGQVPQMNANTRWCPSMTFSALTNRKRLKD